MVRITRHAKLSLCLLLTLFLPACPKNASSPPVAPPPVAAGEAAGGQEQAPPPQADLPDTIQVASGWTLLSYPQAVRYSRQEKRPLFLYFHTPWCGPCKELDKKVFPTPAFQQLAGRLVSIRIDAGSDAEKPVAQRYDVHSYPTMIVCEPGGKEIERFFGYSPTPEFVQRVEDYLAGRNTASDLRDRAHANPKDLALAFKAGRALAIRKRGTEAIPFLERVWKEDAENQTGQVPRAMLLLASTVYLDQLNQPDKAQPILEALSKRFPGTFHGTEATYMIARIYRQSNAVDKAREVLAERIRLNPRDAIQYFRFGSFCMRYGFALDLAIERVTQGLEHHPEADYLWKTLADLYFRDRQLEKAVKTMTRAVEVSGGKDAYKRVLESYQRALSRSKETP